MYRPFRLFAASTEGQTATIFALMAVPLMGFVGMGVDGARWYQGRQATSQAVDAAVLMAARSMQINPTDTVNALDTARRNYLANVATRSVAARDNIDFELTDNNSAVVAKGDAAMKTSFLSVVGIPELSLFSVAAGKGAKATFLSGLNQGTNIEVSLVLDFTGSMCADGQGPCSSGTKVEGLRDAAKELVNIVVNTNQTAFSSRVALVPFSTRIRVAKDDHDGELMNKLTGLPATWSGWLNECTSSSGSGGDGEGNGSWTCHASASRYKTNWKLLPCVTERLFGTRWDADDDVDYTDALPGTGRWLNAHGGDRSPRFYDSSQDKPVAAGQGESENNPTSHWTYAPDPYCADVPESNMILPLTSDKTKLNESIDAFTAGGATAGPLATAFGWYMLSPKWASLWPSDAQPGPYSDITAKQSNGAPVLRKVAVIMTDGVYNTLRGNKDLHKGKVADHAKELCKKMKDEKIEVFTVGFALDQLAGTERTTAEGMLKDCGTSVKHFYSTLNVVQLKDAFRDIALRVTPIRLTQ